MPRTAFRNSEGKWGSLNWTSLFSVKGKIVSWCLFFCFTPSVSGTRGKCPKLGIFMNPAGNSKGFDEKENPDGRGVNDYVITRAWRGGDNPFLKFLRQGQVKVWKRSVVWYEYFLELPTVHF